MPSLTWRRLGLPAPRTAATLMGMVSVTLPLPADLAADLAAAAREEGRTMGDEGVALLRRALAARRLGAFLAVAGSDLSEDEAMQIALEEQRAARAERGR